jgi:hypothetical protein
MSTLPAKPRTATRTPRLNLRLRATVWLPALSLVAAASLLTALPVQAQVPQQLSQQTAFADPPGRVARMNLAEGPVSFAPADSGNDPRWTPAVLNRPLTTGDRLWTGQRARSELHIGSTAVRLGEQTSLDFLELDDDTTQLRLAQGTMKLRVRNLFDGQRIEINTPNLAFVITQPGDYRIDANPATNLGAGTTRVVVQQGAGTIYGDGGAQVSIASGQQANFTDTQLTPAGPAPQVQDGFDAWAHQRDRLEDQSVSARYVPREVIGYQQLDSYGDWQQDPTYGAVWLPRAVPANWAPYRAGHWSWIAPWGWTWVDDAPWGFAPFHYGRWAQIGPRWCWVPGRMAARPVYAPALVAFIGGSAGGVNWNVAIGQQGPRPGLGWFPLAPGEAFRPAYQHSPRYVTNVNQNIVVNNINATYNYRYQREGHAVSVMSAEDFARGQRVRPEGQRFNPADLGRAQVIAPERGGLPQRVASLRDLPRVASPAALPPAAVAVRPVVTSQLLQPGQQRDDRRNDRRDDRRDPRQNDPRQNDPQGNARVGRPGDNLGQLPRPGQPVQPGQAAVVPPQGAASDRGAFDAEQRARAEQHRQQQERLLGQPGQAAMQGQQGLLGQPRAQERQQRELERQQRDLARQQQDRAAGPRQPGDESLGQRAPREQAQRNANVNGNPNPAPPALRPGRPDAAPNAIEQAQRDQQRLQRDQQRQTTDAARQQEQQRRQADESLGQRAQQEQAQRQQQAQRQAQEQQAQQRAQQDQARQQQAAQQQMQERAQQDQQRQAQQQQQQQQQLMQQQRQQQAAEQQAQQAQQRAAQQDQQRQAREQQQQQQLQRQQQDQARQAAAQQQQAAQQQRQQQAQEQQIQQQQQAQQRAQQEQARQQQLAQQQIQQQQQQQQRAQQEQQRQAQQQLMQQQQQRQQPEQPRDPGRARQPRPGEAVSGAPPDERFNRRRE